MFLFVLRNLQVALKCIICVCNDTFLSFTPFMAAGGNYDSDVGIRAVCFASFDCNLSSLPALPLYDSDQMHFLMRQIETRK